MVDTFVSNVTRIFGLVEASWIILGAAIAVFLIILVGFVMTIFVARAIVHQAGIAHIIRGRTRRNVIFFIAFLYCALAVLVIFYMFPGTGLVTPASSALAFMVLPVAVLLWAFLCEMFFECIDNRNRRRSGIMICFCSCNGSNFGNTCSKVHGEGRTTAQGTQAPALDKKSSKQTKQQRESEAESFEKRNVPEVNNNSQHNVPEEDFLVDDSFIEDGFDQEVIINEPKHEEKPRVEVKAPAIVKTPTQVANSAKRSEISDQLARTEKVEREREEAAKWREEIKEMKAYSDSEGEELRRRKFEEERKQLAILAREAKAAQFGSDTHATYDKPAPKPAPKPVPVAPEPKQAITQKPAPVAPVQKQSFDEAAKLAPVLRTVDSVIDAPAQPEARETVVTTTAAAARYQATVSTQTSGSKTTSKFDSLQAKLDLLRKDTAAARPAKAEGKYNEDEVRGALSDLVKSMNARREEE